MPIAMPLQAPNTVVLSGKKKSRRPAKAEAPSLKLGLLNLEIPIR